MRPGIIPLGVSRGGGKQPPISQREFSRHYMPEPMSGCWLWLGALNKGGYGLVSENGHNMTAHRAVYVRHRGPIPAGMQLDHLCRTRCCVNPDHLEPVTASENQLRGLNCIAPATTCTKGHPLTPENTYFWKNGRRCKTCTTKTHKAAVLRFMAKRKAVAS